MPFTPNVASVIKGLDLVVMPSLWEACGLLAMETLVAGTPLIASDCIGLREVVRGTPACVVPSKDSKRLAESTSFFIAHDMRKPFVDFTLTATERFTVEKTAEGIKLLYCKLLI